MVIYDDADDTMTLQSAQMTHIRDSPPLGRSEQSLENTVLIIPSVVSASPSAGKNLDYSVSSRTDDPSPILTPHDRADALSTHQPVTGYFLCTASFLERPESETGIMTRRHKLAAVWR